MNNKSYTVVKWGYLNHHIKRYLDIDFRKVDDLCVKDIIWHSVGRRQDLVNEEMFELLATLTDFQGGLFIVTDNSYEKNLGPFAIDASNIREFARDYLRNFGEQLFNTDVLVISLQLKLVWIFHHNAVYGLVDLN
jgi:hypothetical protein